MLTQSSIYKEYLDLMDVIYFNGKYFVLYEIVKITRVSLLNISKLNIQSLVELGRLTQQTDGNI